VVVASGRWLAAFSVKVTLASGATELPEGGVVVAVTVSGELVAADDEAVPKANKLATMAMAASRIGANHLRSLWSAPR
jgi:hypothetical protein